MLRLTKSEAKKAGINIPSTSRSAVCADYSEDEIHKQAVQAIRDIQGVMHDLCFGCDVGLKVVVRGETKADIDNIFKGVADSLQGIVYKNDKQVSEGYFRRGGRIK